MPKSQIRKKVLAYLNGDKSAVDGLSMLEVVEELGYIDLDDLEMSNIRTELDDNEPHRLVIWRN